MKKLLMLFIVVILLLPNTLLAEKQKSSDERMSKIEQKLHREIEQLTMTDYEIAVQAIEEKFQAFIKAEGDQPIFHEWRAAQIKAITKAEWEKIDREINELGKMGSSERRTIPVIIKKR